MLDALTRLKREGVISALDLHFARLMARLSAHSPEVALAACLVSQQIGKGHSCVDLSEWAGRMFWETGSDHVQAPILGAWVRALAQSPIVGRPGTFCPLILDQANRLYLYRYWAYERRLAETLRQRAVQSLDGRSVERLRRDLSACFAAASNMSPEQKVAVAVALLKPLCVISGGPGTGKTTTVARLLGLLQAQAPVLRIALAAPTGKAAARLQEAIGPAALSMDIWAQGAHTIHRLLGANRAGRSFRYHRANPLPVDVLVVDEVSMVDVALMARLTDALRPEAKLILLGDKAQLASVEAGSVLGDLCGKGMGFSPAFARHLHALTEVSVPTRASSAALADCIVLLQESFRFGARSGIGRLAQAVNAGDPQQALRLLKAGCADLAWQAVGEASLRLRLEHWALAHYRPYLERVRQGEMPAQVMAEFNRARLLSAHRHGPFGVERLNTLIEAILNTHGLLWSQTPDYPGRPVIVTQNDHALRLYNGEVGLMLPDPQAAGRLRVFFTAPDGGLRRFPPVRLPAHETVFAMTVHAAQGSEFDEVALVLPEAVSPIMTRELLYTALTRARRRVAIFGSELVLSEAIGRRLRRVSGLKEALWGEL